jgi:hypothetical protein
MARGRPGLGLTLVLAACSAEHARIDADAICVRALDPGEPVTRIEARLSARCLGATVVVDVAECTVTVEDGGLRLQSTVEWTTGYPSRGQCGGSFEIECEVPEELEAGEYRLEYGMDQASFDTTDASEQCVRG